MSCYEYVIANMNWDSVNKFKKYIAIDHCANFEKDHNQNFLYIKNSGGVFLVYKQLRCSLFDFLVIMGLLEILVNVLKDRPSGGQHQNSFLGLFVSLFGWSCPPGRYGRVMPTDTSSIS